MKRFCSLLLSALLLMGTLTACGGGAAGDTEKDALSVVTTIFPEYDWVMNILGDKAPGADVTLLLDSGVDLHSYQPTADDMIRIASCDLFIYVGGESDAWVEDALKGAKNESMIALDLMDILGSSVKEEEVREGMEAEHEEEHEEEGPEYDEHIWLSLRNAALCVEAIRDALCALDAENAESYTANASAYLEKLNALDEKYTAAVENAKLKTLLFGDRFPFRYLADDYGLDYYAAFTGCSAESEASFETIAFLAKKTEELGLSAVLTLEGTSHKLAETVVAATESKSARILAMDSMQSVTAEDVNSGASYLGIMEKNLSVLVDALK